MLQISVFLLYTVTLTILTVLYLTYFLYTLQAGMSDIVREHDTTASATKRSRMDVISNTSVATHNGSGCNGVQNGDVRLKATSECTDDLQKFDDMFTTLADDLSRVDDPVISDALRWFRRVSSTCIFGIRMSFRP